MRRSRLAWFRMPSCLQGADADGEVEETQIRKNKVRSVMKRGVTAETDFESWWS